MSMSKTYHPLVKGLLDGERSLADLPPELRAEAEEAERLLGAVDRTPVSLSPALDARVMAAVRRRAASPVRRAWRRLVEPREFELRLRIRPWIAWGGALAVVAATALVVLGRPSVIPAGGPTPTRVAARDSIYVRFVLYAPGAKRVAVAGTFNQWDQNAAPLVPAGTSGIWTTTLALPVGQHQYAFVVDGQRWVADPGAPAVDDGFGRRNSVVAVTAHAGRAL